ncbi:MAG: hypothetical protein SFZ02_02320 [bacterium]|nr:hypothetical protein [bacterium]
MLRLSKLVLLLLLVIISVPVHAQSSCGDLSTADCEILQTAQRATGNLPSASFEATAEFALGISFFPELITVRVVSNGVYTRVPTITADIEEAYRPLFGLNADMSIVIDAEISEFVVPEDNTFTAALDLRYVDGVGYAELSKILPLIDPSLDADGWYSVDVADYISRFMRDGIFPSDFLDTFATTYGVDSWESFATEGSNRRLDDVQIGEQSFAVFEASLYTRDYYDDNPDMYQNLIDAFENLLHTQYGAFYTDDQLRNAAEFYADLTTNMQFSLTYWVSLDDGYIHDSQFDFIFIPDEDTPAQPDFDPLGIALLSTAELRFSLDFRYTQFENIPLVSAPDDATPVRYEDLFGYGDSSPF